MERPPLIPRIEDPDLLYAVSALTRTADALRSLLCMAGKAAPEAGAVLLKHREFLEAAEAVVDEFVEYMKVNRPREAEHGQ